jgi:hypothetical protein
MYTIVLLILRLERLVTFQASEHYRLLVQERIYSPISIEDWL